MAPKIDKQVCQAVGRVVEVLLDGVAYKATKYLSTKLVVNATRKLYDGKIPPKNFSSIDIVLTIGKPNYDQREFIKDCLKAKEPFPIKGVILKFPPEKRNLKTKSKKK